MCTKLGCGPREAQSSGEERDDEGGRAGADGSAIWWMEEKRRMKETERLSNEGMVEE